MLVLKVLMYFVLLFLTYEDKNNNYFNVKSGLTRILYAYFGFNGSMVFTSSMPSNIQYH